MDTALEARLQQIIENQVLYQNQHDLQAMLRDMHPESFAYEPAEQFLMRLFAHYRLKFTLLGQKFIAVDEDLVYARTQIRSEKLEGPEFIDNVTDTLIVFRRIDNEWKIWCQAPLLFSPL